MDDVVATLMLRYTSDLATGVARDEAVLSEFSAQTEAVGAKAKGAGAAVEGSSVSFASAARSAATLGDVLMGVGAVTAVVGGGAVVMASQFEDSLAKIAGNTGMTAAQIDQVRQETVKLGAEGPASLNDIAQGFEHAANEGFSGAAAMQVVTAGWKAAVATGGSVADTVNSLAVVLHNLKAPASDAEHVIGVLMATAASANLRLPDLVQNFSKVGVTAAAMHIPLADIGAAYAAVTKATGDASLAQTQLEGMLVHILNPMGQAKAAFKELGTAGDQLRTDFQNLSEGHMSLTKVMEDVRAATHGNAQEIMALFGGIRGGLGALTLLTNGWQSYLAASERTHNANQLLNDEFKNMQQTLGYTVGELKNNLEELGIAVGDSLIRPLDDLAKEAIPVEQALTVMAQNSPGVAKSILELGVALGIAGVALRGVAAAYGPYAAIIRLVAGDTAAAAVTTAAAAAAQTRMAGSTALVDAAMTKWAASLLTTDELIAVLDTELEATAPAAAAAGAGMEGAAASTGLLGGAVDLLTGPVGLIALAVALDVIAYEKSPAVRSGVDQLASALGTDLHGATVAVTDDLSALGATASKTGSALDATGQKIGLHAGFLQGAADSAGHLIKAHDVLANMPVVGSIVQTSDSLQREAKAHDEAAAAAKRHAEMEQQLIDAQRQGGFGLTPTGNNPLNAAFIAAGAQAPGGVTPGSLDYVLPQITTLADAAKQFATEQKSDAANLKADEAAMADSMLHGKGDLDAFRAAAVHDQVAVDQHAAKLQTAGIQVDQAAGDWGAALKGQIAQDTAAFDNARGKLVTAIDAGSGNIHQLAEAAARANDPLLHLTKSGTSADAMIAALTGNTAAAAKAARDFATNLSEAASTSFSNLVKSAYTGKGNEGQLFEKAVGTKRSEDAYTQVSNTEKQKVDKAAGDWADWLVQERQKLQSRVDAAEGKLIADQRSGNRAALPGDESRLKSAESSLASFQMQTDAASNAVKKLAGNGDPITQAQDKAKTSLEALQLAIADGDGPGKIRKLTVEAQRAADHLAKLGLAGEQAALKAGSPSDQITAIGAIAKSAADALVMGIEKSESPAKLKLLSEQADKAAAAAQRLSEAQNHEAQMVGTPSERLSAHDTSDKSGLANAEATITLAIEHHRRVTEADITAAQAHQRAVDADAAAAWNASYAAASTAERHRLLAERAGEVVSQFNTLKGAVQSVTDAERTVYEERTTLIKDALDAMLKSFEDATAVFQAESAASKDAGGAIVTAIDDQTAVFQSAVGTFSSILDAIKSGNNASLALMESILQVAHDQFQVSLDQQALDAVQATWQQKIDADNVKLATDKATLDTAQAAATIALGRDQLILDHDKVKLAQDQLKLTELTNKGIELIASHFGDVSAYDKEITSVLRTISTDSSQINSDQQQLDSDTRLYDSLIANATLKLDQDQRQLAQDQSSSDAGSAAGQARISGDKQRLAADQALQQGLQALAAATQAVTDSFNQLASDESKTVVDGLNEMVTAVSDATSVFQAMAGVGKAGADGQIKAIQDQSAIIKAQGDIAVAQTAAQLVIGRDELVIADDQLQADQMAAAWNVRIALDQVKIATDKAATDALKSQWDHTIDLDTLQVDKDKIKLAQDQLSLTVLTNAGIDMLAQLLGGDPSGYEGAMTGALQQINADQSQIATDQARQVQDQQLAAQQEAQAALQAAYDQRQLARDQAASDASSQAGQMRIAQDQLKLTADQVAQQIQTNALLSMSLTEMQAWFAPMLDAMRNLRSGVDYHWVGSGPDPFQQWQNSAPAQFAQNPSYRG